MKKAAKENKPRDYNELIRLINKTLDKTIGKTTIKTGKKRECIEVREKRRQKREARKEFNTACKEDREDKKEKLDLYRKTQENLRKTLYTAKPG